MNRTRTRATALAALALLVGLPALLHAEEGCDATVTSELRRTDEKETVTTYVFKVDISTMEACANIRYALSTTERLPSGETKVFETPGEVNLRAGSTTQALTYDLKKENTMVEWKIEKTGCARCEP